MILRGNECFCQKQVFEFVTIEPCCSISKNFAVSKNLHTDLPYDCSQGECSLTAEITPSEQIHRNTSNKKVGSSWHQNRARRTLLESLSHF